MTNDINCTKKKIFFAFITLEEVDVLQNISILQNYPTTLLNIIEKDPWGRQGNTYRKANTVNVFLILHYFPYLFIISLSLHYFPYFFIIFLTLQFFPYLFIIFLISSLFSLSLHYFPYLFTFSLSLHYFPYLFIILSICHTFYCSTRQVRTEFKHLLFSIMFFCLSAVTDTDDSQDIRGGDHVLFLSTTSTRSQTFRHLFATLPVRLPHTFNRIACNYQAATRWDLPPYWITIWLIDDVMLIFVCLLADLILGFGYRNLAWVNNDKDNI